jgi:hypothetical protein
MNIMAFTSWVMISQTIFMKGRQASSLSRQTGFQPVIFIPESLLRDSFFNPG